MMKRIHFWLVICLVSIVHEVLFVWASRAAMMREPKVYGIAVFLIVLLWIVEAMALILLDLCALIDMRLIPKDTRVDPWTAFRFSGLTKWGIAGRTAFLMAAIVLVCFAFALFAAAGVLSAAYALSGGLLLILLYSWRDAVVRGARISRANGRIRHRWGAWILLAAVLFPVLDIAWNMTAGYGDAVYRNWEVELPGGYQQVYAVDDGPSFNGDGMRYHVLYYPAGVDLEDLLDWTEDGDTGGAVEVLDELDVPASERPDLSQCLLWYARQEDRSRIWLLWDREAATVYIVEFFL